MKHFFPSILILSCFQTQVFAKSKPEELKISIQINRQRHARLAPILAISEKRSDHWQIEDDTRSFVKILVTRFAKVQVDLQSFSKTKAVFFIDGCDLAKILALSNLENCEIGNHPIYVSLSRDQPTLISLNFLDDEAREVIFTLDH